MNLVEKSSHNDREKSNKSETESKRHISYMSNTKQLECVLCGKADHSVTIDHFGRQVVQYFSCKMFVDMTPKERFKLLYEKGLCYQCLSPGAKVEHGKHKNASCFSKFVCKSKTHSKYPRKKHVLCCEEHKSSSENAKLLEEYKRDNIFSLKSPVSDFSKQIMLNFHCENKVYTSDSVNQFDDGEVTDSSVYILQTIKVNDRNLNLFYDSGCGDLVCRKEAVTELEKSGGASLLIPGPITLGGVGDIKTETPHGIYKIDIPLCSGKLAVMRGVCLDQITAKFPMYPLQTQFQKDIIDNYKLAGKDPFFIFLFKRIIYNIED